MAQLPRGFYAILDVTLDATPAELEDPAGLATRARQLLAAAPSYLQLRAKSATARAMYAAAQRLLALCREAGVPFCVNDRLDVALAVGADAVHLGQDDLSLADARRVCVQVGRQDLIIGFSTHTRAQAVAAAEGGADYIGFGPVFGTATKAKPDPTVGTAVLADVCATVRVPVVAIGGITLDNVAEIAKAGAAAAAVIAAVSDAPDPTAAGQRVASAFARVNL